MFGALKPGFRSLATLKRVVNVVGKIYQHFAELMVQFSLARPILPEPTFYVVTCLVFTVIRVFFCIHLLRYYIFYGIVLFTFY